MLAFLLCAPYLLLKTRRTPKSHLSLASSRYLKQEVT